MPRSAPNPCCIAKKTAPWQALRVMSMRSGGPPNLDNLQCWRGFSTVALFLGRVFRYTPQVFRIAIFEDSFIEVSGP